MASPLPASMVSPLVFQCHCNVAVNEMSWWADSWPAHAAILQARHGLVLGSTQQLSSVMIVATAMAANLTSLHLHLQRVDVKRFCTA